MWKKGGLIGNVIADQNSQTTLLTTITIIHTSVGQSRMSVENGIKMTQYYLLIMNDVPYRRSEFRQRHHLFVVRYSAGREYALLIF